MEKNKRIIKNIMSYVIIIGIAILIKMFVFSPIRVNGTSMSPTLKDGDIMILNEIGYHLNGLNRFDIAVVNHDGEKLIKRVIGLPGEEIEYKDNNLYVNGELVVENFTHADTSDFKIEELGDTKVPENHYFLMGDNRTNSKDSRYIGFVHKSKIMGKTKLIIYPFNRVSTVQ